MHRVKKLFEQVCSMRNLRLAAKEALRGKRSRPPGAVFFGEQEKELPALHEELWGGTYRHGPYHYFWIHDPKERLVAAAPFRDRVVHHAIVRVIEPIFEKRFIEDSYACRRGKGNNNNPTNENNNIGFRVSEAPELQVAQACGLIRAGGQSSSGRAVLRDHPVVRRVRRQDGQAKKKARPW